MKKILALTLVMTACSTKSEEEEYWGGMLPPIPPAPEIYIPDFKLFD